MHAQFQTSKQYVLTADHSNYRNQSHLVEKASLQVALQPLGYFFFFNVARTWSWFKYFKVLYLWSYCWRACLKANSTYVKVHVATVAVFECHLLVTNAHFCISWSLFFICSMVLSHWRISSCLSVWAWRKFSAVFSNPICLKQQIISSLTNTTSSFCL